MAIFCARITFFAVMGKNAPAFTVASLAMIMKMRPHTRARPVIVPAEGAPPHSSYISQAAKIPSSKNCEPGSISLAMRSRAVRRPFLCCDSMAFAPPPWRICSSSFLILVSKSTMRRVFFSNSGDFGFTLVFSTEADTRGPHTQAISNHLKCHSANEQCAPSVTVYGFCFRFCEWALYIRRNPAGKVYAPAQKQGKLAEVF